MVLEGVLLGGGGLHGESVICPNWNIVDGGDGPLCLWSQLLYPLKSRAFGCSGAERSSAAGSPVLGVAPILANADEGSWRLFLVRR